MSLIVGLGSRSSGSTFLLSLDGDILTLCIGKTMMGEAENTMTAIVMVSVTAKRMLTVDNVFGLLVGDSPAVQIV